MKDPILFSMESLLAEDGQEVRAGLPEEMRRDIERRDALRQRAEQAKEARAQIDRVLAAIAEHEARIAELQQELEAAMRKYAYSTIHPPGAQK
jgi:hypothetical protein